MWNSSTSIHQLEKVTSQKGKHVLLHVSKTNELVYYKAKCHLAQFNKLFMPSFFVLFTAWGVLFVLTVVGGGGGKEKASLRPVDVFIHVP